MGWMSWGSSKGFPQAGQARAENTSFTSRMAEAAILINPYCRCTLGMVFCNSSFCQVGAGLAGPDFPLALCNALTVGAGTSPWSTVSRVALDSSLVRLSGRVPSRFSSGSSCLLCFLGLARTMSGGRIAGKRGTLAILSTSCSGSSSSKASFKRATWALRSFISPSCWRFSSWYRFRYRITSSLVPRALSRSSGSTLSWAAWAAFAISAAICSCRAILVLALRYLSDRIAVFCFSVSRALFRRSTCSVSVRSVPCTFLKVSFRSLSTFLISRPTSEVCRDRSFPRADWKKVYMRWNCSATTWDMSWLPPIFEPRPWSPLVSSPQEKPWAWLLSWWPSPGIPL
mmetsp:Transcript_21311/g.54411  ORF Transcript_21311/g.54411 Transcript_21311/m.54411 type:complete len:342 (-) Transcript_21311:107-1132(-)